MLALILAASVQFSPAQLEKALEDVDTDVRIYRELVAAGPRCNQLNYAILGARKIRQTLADGKIFLGSAELVSLNGGDPLYKLNMTDQRVLDDQAMALETNAAVLGVRCRR